MASQSRSKTTKKKPITLLIDGDLILYRASAACQIDIDWGDGVWSVDAVEADGIELAQGWLEAWREVLGASKIILTFNGHGNFRKDVHADYKANRANVRKPLLYKPLKDWLRENYPYKQIDGLESDDLMGILATIPGRKDRRIIVSSDKDMQQIPGELYDPFSSSPELVQITEQQGDYYHLLQTLTGDTTDNYGGCPGVGDVRARRALDVDPTWECVVQTYAKAGLGEECALEQARVARICRASDFDFERKEPILWLPESSRKKTSANSCSSPKAQGSKTSKSSKGKSSTPADGTSITA